MLRNRAALVFLATLIQTAHAAPTTVTLGQLKATPSEKQLHFDHVSFPSRRIAVATTIANYTVTLVPMLRDDGTQFTRVFAEYDFKNYTEDNDDLNGGYGGDYAIIFHDALDQELDSDRAHGEFDRSSCTYGQAPGHAKIVLGDFRRGLFDEAVSARINIAAADNDEGC
jgi:hypothetical protein